MMEQVKGQSPFVHRLIVSCMKRSPSDRPVMAQIITDLDKQTQLRMTIGVLLCT